MPSLPPQLHPSGPKRAHINLLYSLVRSVREGRRDSVKPVSLSDGGKLCSLLLCSDGLAVERRSDLAN